MIGLFCIFHIQGDHERIAVPTADWTVLSSPIAVPTLSSTVIVAPLLAGEFRSLFRVMDVLSSSAGVANVSIIPIPPFLVA